jgi:hypothetical protein
LEVWPWESDKPEHQQQLEDEVNAWLEQNRGITIVDIRQSACGGSFSKAQFFITVIYEPAD